MVFYIDYSRLPFMESEYGIYILIGVIVLLPLISALIATTVQLSKMKTAHRDEYASGYIKHGSFKLKQSHDIFLYASTTRMAKPQQNNNRPGGRK